MNIRFFGVRDVISNKISSNLGKRIVFSSLAFALLSGCVGSDSNETDKNESIVSSDAGTSINLAMPRSLVSRKIESSEYTLVLDVSGTNVSMEQDGESWVGETFVPFGTELIVNLNWYARGIPLATLNKNYGSASASNPISISSTDYSYPDEDNDELSNFAELDAEPASDPFDEDSPGAPVAVNPENTSEISGVYVDVLANGDSFAIFVSDTGTYQYLNYGGDIFDNFGDCWALDTNFYSVKNLGDGFYDFEVTFAMAGSEYFVYLDPDDADSTTLLLESSVEILNWEIVGTFYTDPSELFEESLYCDF